MWKYNTIIRPTQNQSYYLLKKFVLSATHSHMCLVHYMISFAVAELQMCLTMYHTKRIVVSSVAQVKMKKEKKTPFKEIIFDGSWNAEQLRWIQIQIHLRWLDVHIQIPPIGYVGLI